MHTNTLTDKENSVYYLYDLFFNNKYTTHYSKKKNIVIRKIKCISIQC